MDTKKYEKLLFEKIKNQVVDWFDVKEASLPDDDELFRFLHSIKGTAGTIGMEAFSELASKLMAHVEEGSRKQWKREELRDFLHELISRTYERDNLSDIKNTNLPVIQVISTDISEIVVLKEAMENNGWMVMSYTSHEKARASKFDIQPDCIVIDERGKSGGEIYSVLERRNPDRFLPVILLSSENSVDTRIDAFRNGIDDFIAAPVHLEELNIRVWRQLQTKKLFDNLADKAAAVEAVSGQSENEAVMQETQKVLNVSIIDDDAIIRSLLGKVLSRLDAPGYQIDIQLYENGQKFFEQERLNAVGEHFIILDGVMPVMDGMEVLQKVRQERDRTVKVLMLTGRKNEYEIARALKLGADDYVTKPFSITELEARIKVLIQRRT